MQQKLKLALLASLPALLLGGCVLPPVADGPGYSGYSDYPEYYPPADPYYYPAPGYYNSNTYYYYEDDRRDGRHDRDHGRDHDRDGHHHGPGRDDDDHRPPPRSEPGSMANLGGRIVNQQRPSATPRPKPPAYQPPAAQSNAPAPSRSSSFSGLGSRIAPPPPAKPAPPREERREPPKTENKPEPKSDGGSAASLGRKLIRQREK